MTSPMPSTKSSGPPPLKSSRYSIHRQPRRRLPHYPPAIHFLEVRPHELAALEAPSSSIRACIGYRKKIYPSTPMRHYSDDIQALRCPLRQRHCRESGFPCSVFQELLRVISRSRTLQNSLPYEREVKEKCRFIGVYVK